MNDKITFLDLADSDMLQRPPSGLATSSTTKPLIVTPTFVSRSDSTPWSERPHDKGSAVDSNGHEVPQPDVNYSQLALEPAPNLAFEHWDEYWRKVHGPKFAFEEPGTTNEAVLKYDQVHRIASGPSTWFRPPYRAMIDATGRLESQPAGNVPPYRRPCWDGFAYIVYGEEADIAKTLGQEQYATRIIADEQTVFRMVTREVARQYIIIPSAKGRDPVSLVKIHVRHQGLSREKFQQRWLHEHADLVTSKVATREYVRRYAQLHPFGLTQEDPEGSKIDGISVLSFASLNDVEDYLATLDYADIEAAEAELCDPGRSEFWTAINYNVINRLVPELATTR